MARIFSAAAVALALGDVGDAAAAAAAAADVFSAALDDGIDASPPPAEARHLDGELPLVLFTPSD